MFRYPKEVREHVRWAKKNGFCCRCVHPWFDETCGCGNYIKHYDRMNNIQKIVIEIHEKEWEKKEKNPKVKDKQRKARSDLYDLLTEEFTESQLEEIENDVEAVRKEI